MEISKDYTEEQYESRMLPILEKHELTKEKAEELSKFKSINKHYKEYGIAIFDLIDEFLNQLETCELDHEEIKKNIKKILRGANFAKVPAMFELLSSKNVQIPLKDFFNKPNVFLLDFNLKDTKEAIKIMKRAKYDYNSMLLKCRELTVTPQLSLLKDFRNILRANAHFENEQTPKAIAENVPSLFTHSTYLEVPKILKALSHSTYTTIRTNKYTKKEEVVDEKLFQPIDRILLSNGDLLSMEDASEIEKLNQFLKDNDINVLQIFSKNTSIYRRAKYDIYAPAYELAIRLRAGNDEKKYQSVKKEINDIIISNPSWLVSITEDSVRNGFEQSNELCDWNKDLADIYHIENPNVSTKSNYCDFKKLLSVLTYVYGDSEKAKEVMIANPKARKIKSASIFEKVFKELESSEQYASNRQELVNLIDENLDKVTRKNIAYFLCPQEGAVKDKTKRYKRPKDKQVSIDQTNVKIYNLSKAKTSALTVDCNNLSKKMKAFFQMMLINASLGKVEEIEDKMMEYILDNKALVESLKAKEKEQKVNYSDLTKHLKEKKKQASNYMPLVVEKGDEQGKNEEDKTSTQDEMLA